MNYIKGMGGLFLTDVECARLDLTIKGCTQKQIAYKLKASEVAVKRSLARARNRNGCNTITELAVKYALAGGLDKSGEKF